MCHCGTACLQSPVTDIMVLPQTAKGVQAEGGRRHDDAGRHLQGRPPVDIAVRAGHAHADPMAQQVPFSNLLFWVLSQQDVFCLTPVEGPAVENVFHQGAKPHHSQI